jgi:general secretion pathway protein A
MYCKFFGFSEKPFSITPDPKYLYLSPIHEELLTSLVYGIQERLGVISVVGEVGTGKTVILNTAFDWLSSKTRLAYMFNFDLNFEDLIIMTLVELGLAESSDALSKIEAIKRLKEFALEQLLVGGTVAIIVDEAQNLSRQDMENLRLLSNLETRTHKLIQIVLAGQPELDHKLDSSELRQLKQRICLRRCIHPLNEKETFEYIQHRLSVADYNGHELFESEARDMLWKFTGGVPRKINILCDNALRICSSRKSYKIEAPDVVAAAKELRWEPHDWLQEEDRRKIVLS